MEEENILLKMMKLELEKCFKDFQESGADFMNTDFICAVVNNSISCKFVENK